MALAAVGLSTHIFNNHLKSVLLLAAFPALLVLMTGMFFFAFDVTLMLYLKDGNIRWGQAWDSAVSGALHYSHWALLTAGLWFIVAYFLHGLLMRAASGSVPVTRQQMPRIYNMLENLCISRGIPMPQFEVIDSPALNAFACGIDQKSYKIVLTRGIIDRLTDDELESVIAHELTHIINRDVRLLVIAVIFVGMLSFTAEVLYRSMVQGRRYNAYVRGNKNDRSGLIMLIALVILLVGYFLAILIRFALSRKREYLADAGSVELTKNPDAMMRALLRISGEDKVSGMPDVGQQMCIENSHNFMGIFATHPPIEARVKAISDMTNTPIPSLQVSLRRGPRKPWDSPEQVGEAFISAKSTGFGRDTSRQAALK